MVLSDEEKKKKREYDREYRSRPEVKAKKKEYGQRPEVKAKKRKATNRYRKDLKLEVYSVYSKRQSNSEIPCCRCCGENSYIEFLTVDHIDGRANLPKKEQKLYAEKITSWLKRNHYPEGFQILCHNCNSAKGNSVDNKCPHERERN